MSILLFVVCMEYLSRLVRKVGEHQLFKFHLRCKRVKLNQLMFANDVKLCCGGGFPSVYTLLQAVKLYSASFGVNISETKSVFHIAGLEMQCVQRIKEDSSFAYNILPFKYIGVLICARRIKMVECNILVEKMAARIRVWSSIYLSYARRLQLINFVLLSIHVHWGEVYVLHRTSLENINKVCRVFLWSDNYSIVNLAMWLGRRFVLLIKQEV